MSRTTVFSVVLVFLVGAFAGCVAQEREPVKTQPTVVKRGATDPAVYESRLSKELYSEVIKERAFIPSFDGKRIDNWVFRPKVPDGTKVPVFINFSPYWANNPPTATTQSGGDAFSLHMIKYFVPRGYAIVLSSARGTGESEGCFNIGGDAEKKDANAVIDYYSKQPWSNGNIGAGGKSYDGTIANGVATLAHPALKMIFPVEPITELYLYSFKGGIQYRATFSATYFGSESTPQTYTSNPLLLPEDAICPDLKGHIADNLVTGVTGDDAPYWKERNYTKDISKYKGATFYVQGFNDWNVKPDSITPFLNLMTGPKVAYLHNWTQQGTGHVYPMREDWNATMLRFMDETMKGIDTGIFDEPAFHVQDSEGVWHWETEWPPARAAATKFFFGLKDGKGTIDGTAFRGGVRTFQDNGQAPAATTTSGTNFLRYESPVLAQDVRYSGVPRVHLQASTNAPVGKVVASLIDLAPDGSARVINWGGLNMRHRASVERPLDVQANTQYTLNFEMFPQDDVVRAGHRLVLLLAGNAPGSAWSPGGFGYTTYPTQNTVSVLEDEQAFVELPIITTMDLESPQPVQIRCFAC